MLLILRSQQTHLTDMFKENTYVFSVKHWERSVCLYASIKLTNELQCSSFSQHSECCTVLYILWGRNIVEFIRVINVADSQVWVQRRGWKFRRSVYLKPGLWVGGENIQVHPNRWSWVLSGRSCNLAGRQTKKVKSMLIAVEMKCMILTGV